jgi:hypothetical protein
VAFFARTRADTRLWQTRLAPALGTLGLCAVGWLVLDNFTTLIGGSGVLAHVFEALVVLAFAAGAAFAAMTGRTGTGCTD